MANISSVFAQKLQLIDSVAIDTLTAVSMDKTGNVFLCNEKGEISKYSSFGKLLDTFIPQQPAVVGSIEAWQMLRVFVFYGQSQQYLYLDRFLNATEPQLLSEFTNGFVSHATPGEDNSIWLINETALSLEKYDLRTARQVVNTDLLLFVEEDYQFTDIKTYQNKVYINLKKQGILVFDLFGNFIQKLPLENVSHLNFYNDTLYYPDGTFLHKYNLYSFQEHLLTIPEKIKPLFCLANATQIALLTEQMMYLCRVIE